MLTTLVANKIAAGEVVERPASVLKELLENALDAGATRVDIAVTAGGRKLISVSDNGCGMNRDDALMAPERQATSKIRDADDIEKIATFGFRGEALASIAAVSRFALFTRRRGDDFGTEVSMAGGKMLDVKDCGCPPGTCIEVRDLFFNVPARRNFLRAFATEQAHIRNTFLLHAVANPGVAMSLKLDGDLAYQLAPCENLLDRIRELFGADEAEHLLPIDRVSGRIRVFGYAGVPSWTRNDRAGQRVYVNRRPATAATIQAAISASYPKADDERKPVAFLFIDLPPEQVDVNVHPTKREVRFRNNSEVRDAVMAALRGALGGEGAGGGMSGGASDDAPGNAPGDTPDAVSFSGGGVFPPRPPAPRQFDFPAAQPAPQSAPQPQHGDAEPQDASASASSARAPAPEAAAFFVAPEGAPWKRYRLLARLSRGFALLETEDGLVVLDPSAAHERVVYEKLLGELAGTEAAAQPLLFPETVEMAPLDFRRVESVLGELRRLGFGVSAFEKKAFVVDALPAVVSGAAPRDLLFAVSEALEQAGQRRGREKLHHEIVARAAAKAAVRAGAALDDAAINAIISDLVRCAMPYTSPAGRATMHLTSFNELNRRFGRV